MDMNLRTLIANRFGSVSATSSTRVYLCGTGDLPQGNNCRVTLGEQEHFSKPVAGCVTAASLLQGQALICDAKQNLLLISEVIDPSLVRCSIFPVVLSTSFQQI
ncbi:hypothetical protein [Roseibium sp.]|uniref:hypothetical protein n=1 Tax=Roseibium sp. TaxID=1936156 RepID=UPI003BAC9153